MSSGTDILIAGGYGEVGHRLAEDLAREHSGRLIIAGRDQARAVALAASLGNARAVRLDVNDPRSVEEALAGVAVVVSCVDQKERLLLRAALRRGLAYTDITPRLSSLRYSGGGNSVLSMRAAAQALRRPAPASYSERGWCLACPTSLHGPQRRESTPWMRSKPPCCWACLLYTSDAADE